MAKEKWTCKKVREVNAIKVGYCEAWHLLKGLEPIGYTAGIYGWNEDIYYVGNNTYIATGYRPHGTRSVSYEFLEAYENQARAIYNGKDYYDDKIAKIAEIRKEFLKSACN